MRRRRGVSGPRARKHAQPLLAARVHQSSLPGTICTRYLLRRHVPVRETAESKAFSIWLQARTQELTEGVLYIDQALQGRMQEFALWGRTLPLFPPFPPIPVFQSLSLPLSPSRFPSNPSPFRSPRLRSRASLNEL